MLVAELTDLQRKESHIYYRHNFTAVAVYSILKKEKRGKIEFAIEYKPVGGADITLKIIDVPDYPVLPIRVELKKSIKSLMDKNIIP